MPIFVCFLIEEYWPVEIKVLVFFPQTVKYQSNAQKGKLNFTLVHWGGNVHLASNIFFPIFSSPDLNLVSFSTETKKILPKKALT